MLLKEVHRQLQACGADLGEVLQIATRQIFEPPFQARLARQQAFDRNVGLRVSLFGTIPRTLSLMRLISNPARSTPPSIPTARHQWWRHGRAPDAGKRKSAERYCAVVEGLAAV